MKQYLVKRVLVAGLVLLAAPVTLLAQKEKQKDKNEVEQIIITRRGNTDEKTTIEINGDKIKVNGKNIEDLKNSDITVNRNHISGMRAMARARTGNGENWNFDMNDNAISLFSEDANRAMLGVATDENDKGALVTNITKESAAEKAGLKEGDIITRIDDKKVEDADDVATIVHSHKPGEKVTITYLRNNKEEKTTAELSKWKGVRINAMNINPMIAPGADAWTPAPPTPPFNGNIYFSTGGGQPKLGLSVQDTDNGKGVKVLDVADDSNAAKAGVKKDDIITSINDQEVNTTDEVTRYIRSNRDKTSLNLKVLRNGKTQNIEVRMPRKLKTADL